MAITNPGTMEIVLTSYIYDPLSRPFYKKLVRSLGLSGGEKVLDFGSGFGAASRQIARLLEKGGGELVCLDISPRWTEVARRKLRGFGNATVLCGDIRELELDSAPFDIVFTHFMLHDIPAAERPSTLGALCANLRSGGKLFVREPVKESHGIGEEEIKRLLGENGLEETEATADRSIWMGPLYRAVFRKK